jgi:hypothetical protein
MNSDRQLVEWDWLITYYATRLHFAEFTDDEATQLVMHGISDGKLRYICGFTGTDARIPGFFERQAVQRCKRCCDLLGYPQGIGSPKNDNATRPLVQARIDAP